ncbi:MAG: hypothetical protein ACLQU1_13075 [Bryobacteraceae bacterium]
MRHLLRLAARLYPPAWRMRYGAEFDALLEDAGPSWPALGDVLKGAIVMQLTAGSFAKIIAVCGAIGLAGAAVVAISTHDTYISTAVLQLDHVPTGEDLAMRLERIDTDVLSRGSLAAMIQKLDLYPEERKSLPFEDVVQHMKNRTIQIRPFRPVRNGRETGPLAGTFQIRFSYPDRVKAQAVTRELTTRVIADGTPVVSLTVLDPASLPEQPSEPNRSAWILAGLVIGLAAGIILAGVRRWPAVALCGIAGMLLAGVISFAIPDTWMSSAVVRVTPPESAAPVVGYIRQNGGGTEVRELQGHSGAFRIRSSDHDRFKAQAAVQQVVARLIEDNLTHRVTGSGVKQVELLDPASLPQLPIQPNRLAIALLGLMVGLALGLLWQWMRPRRALILPTP